MLKKSVSSHSLLSSFLSASLLSLVVTSCACTDNRKPEANNQNYQDSNNNTVAQVAGIAATQSSIRQAVVEVKPYKNHQISGKVTFTKVPEGIKIVADISGLQSGKHGFHVHEHGDCSGEDGMKAGGHFNPTNSKHGGPDSPERHVGDFGNLEADESGHAHYERVDTIIAFEGPNSILGKSIVIHADPDDYVTQPTGASGARIACGKIEAVQD